MLPDGDKTKGQLISELVELRQRVAGLETLETERKQAAGKHQVIVQTALDGFWISDLEGRLLEVNDSYCKMVGYTREELLTMSIPDIEAVERPEETVRHIKKIVEQGYDCFETRHKCRGGKIIDVEVSVNYLDVGQGQLFVFLRDITERKRMEEALRESEERIHTIVSNAPVVIWSLDKEGIFTLSEGAGLKALGLSPGEVVGQSVFDVYRDVPKILEDNRRALAGEIFVSIVEVGKLVFESHYSPIRDKNGEVIGMVGVSTDITERKDVEEALRESEEKYRSLVNNVKFGVFRSTPEPAGRYLEVNPAMTEITGYSREELLGMNVSDLYVHSEEREVIHEEMASGKGKVTNEIHFRKKDGTEIAVLAICAVVGKDAGKTICYDGFLEDITERKRVEKELRESEEKYRSLINNVKLGVFRSTPEPSGRFLEANPAMTEITGYRREELLQMNVSDLYVRPEERESLLEEIASAKGRAIKEVHLRKKDGTEIVVSDTKVAVRDDAGEIIYFDGILEDITERKRTEEALRESEEKYRSLINNVKLGVFRSTPEPAGRYLEVNPAMTEITGYSREELLQMNVSDLYVHPEERVSILEEIALAKGRATNEVHLRKKDGTEIVALTGVAAVRDNAGKILYFDGITEDITERKRAEEREKQLQQELNLSSRLASIGQLAAGVAHEINNPLTGILGFSQLLLRKSHDEKVRRDLETIHSGGLRVAKIVENMLIFARHDKPKKQHSDINDILQKALELRAYELKTSDIEVVTDLAPNLPKVVVDFGQIQQVFLNIILNAEQAMVKAHKGGRLTIKTQQMEGYIRISFADNGPGIPAEHLDKLFDPFFTTKEVGKGTGLGLSISHGIITEHGGRIYAESEPEKGTTFFVELPLATAKIDEVKLARNSPLRK